jgi:hypothetical protein
MAEPNNGQSVSPTDDRLLAPKGSQARYTGELLLRDPSFLAFSCATIRDRRFGLELLDLPMKAAF